MAATNGRRPNRPVPEVSVDEVRAAMTKYGYAVTVSYLATLVWWARGGKGRPASIAGQTTDQPPIVKAKHVQSPLAALVDSGEVVTALGHEVDAKLGGVGNGDLRHNTTYYGFAQRTPARGEAD